MNRDLPYFIIPSAFITFGTKKILLLDTERNQNYTFPIAFKDVICNDNNYSIEEALIKFKIDHESLNLFFDLLLKNDLIYFSKNHNLYAPINKEFDFFSHITNAVIDINHNVLEFDQIFKELDLLCCRHLQIRSLQKFDETIILNIINQVTLHYFESLEFYFSYNNNSDEDKILDIMAENPNIDCIIFYLCPYEEKSLKTKEGQMLYYTKSNFTPLNCGVVSPDYFTTAIPAYSESLHHNSCLNRKISIDAEGNIKNCPSMKESYGNIRDTTLAEAIEKPGFKKYWNINKDQIAICKDCEFRYICTDCRAYVEEPEDTSGPDGTNLSKPLKCGYNPYTGEWAEWSINPLKQKAIDFYGMRDMVSNEELKIKNEE